MSYRTIKNYLVKRLSVHQLTESKNKFDLTAESDLNFNQTFIIENPSSTVDEGLVVVDKYFPDRSYAIQIAFRISETGAIYEYDSMHDKLDRIIKDLPNPSNFQSDSIRDVKYISHEVEPTGDYFLATINLLAQDELDYA